MEAPKSKHPVPRSEESTITALAKEAHTTQDVVQHFYDQEVASLEAEATVKNFIGIIAGRRVRRRLKARSSLDVTNAYGVPPEDLGGQPSSKAVAQAFTGEKTG